MILVFGTVCLDRIHKVPRLPQPGGYVEIESSTLSMGGEALNTAMNLQTWGSEYVLVGNGIGHDSAANDLRRLIQARGLRQPTLAPLGTECPVCDLYVTPDGQRTMFGRGFLTLGDQCDLDSLPTMPGAWFTTDSNPGKTARQAAHLAKSAGMHVYVMDFADSDDRLPEGSTWQSSTDWIGEAGNPAKNLKWLREFTKRQGVFGILSDGARGFAAGGLGMPVRWYEPMPSPAVVDSTGCGDSFRAGMLHGLAQGWEIANCLLFASASGALNCRAPGAIDGIGTVAEIEALIDAHPSVRESYRS